MRMSGKREEEMCEKWEEMCEKWENGGYVRGERN